MFGLGEPNLKAGDKVWVRNRVDKSPDRYMVVYEIQYSAALMREDKPGAQWDGFEIAIPCIQSHEGGWSYDGAEGGG